MEAEIDHFTSAPVRLLIVTKRRYESGNSQKIEAKNAKSNYFAFSSLRYRVFVFVLPVKNNLRRICTNAKYPMPASILIKQTAKEHGKCLFREEALSIRTLTFENLDHYIITVVSVCLPTMMLKQFLNKHQRTTNDYK